MVWKMAVLTDLLKAGLLVELSVVLMVEIWVVQTEISMAAFSVVKTVRKSVDLMVKIVVA